MNIWPNIGSIYTKTKNLYLKEGNQMSKKNE